VQQPKASVPNRSQNDIGRLTSEEIPMPSDASQASTHPHFQALLERAAPLPPVPTAVIAPESGHSLGGAILAARHTLIEPILIGDRGKIETAAQTLGADISAYEIVEESNHRAAAALAVKLVNEGRAKSIMKGSLHTEELLGPIVKRDTGLRTGRRLSHVFVLDVPGHPELLMITDAAINIFPDLETKVSIAQNAIDLAHVIGIDDPRVGVMSAVETVNDKIPATLDAAALSKMADRGQIKRGKVDGPLAMDNAVNMDAAKTKGITSVVAGRANILLAPSMEAGNMLVKGLTFLAGAQTGGIVLGAKCPVILTSRADDDDARLASCVIATLLASA
jgi:phosphate butyryltransferase